MRLLWLVVSLRVVCALLTTTGFRPRAGRRVVSVTIKEGGSSRQKVLLGENNEEAGGAFPGGREAVAAMRSAVAFAQLGSRGPQAAAERTRELRRCRGLSELELRAVLVGRGVEGANSLEVGFDLLAELLAELRLSEVPARPSRRVAERRSTPWYNNIPRPSEQQQQQGRRRAKSFFSFAAPESSWEKTVQEASDATSELGRFLSREAQTLADAILDEPHNNGDWRARAKSMKRKIELARLGDRARRGARRAQREAGRIAQLGARRGTAAVVDLGLHSARRVGRWAAGDLMKQDHLLVLLAVVAFVTKRGPTAIAATLVVLRAARTLITDDQEAEAEDPFFSSGGAPNKNNKKRPTPWDPTFSVDSFF